MVTACSYEARACAHVCVCVCVWFGVCVYVCPHNKLHGVTSQNSVMPTVATVRSSNLTIILISCLLTSQCVSSAHSVCTPYSTERGMNATWLSLSWAFRSSRMWQRVITQGSPEFWRVQQTQGHNLPWTCQELLAQCHSITSQTAWILSKNAVRTSNLHNFISLSCVTFVFLTNFKCDS